MLDCRAVDSSPHTVVNHLRNFLQRQRGLEKTTPLLLTADQWREVRLVFLQVQGVPMPVPPDEDRRFDGHPVVVEGAHAGPDL